MEKFRALLVSKTDTGQKAEFVDWTEDQLMPGDVTIRVSHSSVNYKDGLAVTGKGPIVRQFPLIPGIDLAGKVISSQHPRWHVGDDVVLGGWGVGEGHHGGFSQIARVKGDWLVPLPKGWKPQDAMAVGVAGYTSMLCVMALEEQGVKPDQGEIIVTGSAGGVGSVAILLLSKLGYKVAASTRRMNESDFLKSLGATTIVDAAELNTPVKPLGQGALGWWRGQCRLGHARQHAVDDHAGRRSGSLRPRTRHGPANKRRTLYFARREADRHQFGDHASAQAPGNMGQADARSRSRQASHAYHNHRPQRRAARGRRHRGRKNPRPRRRRRETSAAGEQVADLRAQSCALDNVYCFVRLTVNSPLRMRSGKRSHITATGSSP